VKDSVETQKPSEAPVIKVCVKMQVLSLTILKNIDPIVDWRCGPRRSWAGRGPPALPPAPCPAPGPRPAPAGQLLPDPGQASARLLLLPPQPAHLGA
jgi:hypothetical protein